MLLTSAIRLGSSGAEAGASSNTPHGSCAQRASPSFCTSCPLPSRPHHSHHGLDSHSRSRNWLWLLSQDVPSSSAAVQPRLCTAHDPAAPRLHLWPAGSLCLPRRLHCAQSRGCAGGSKGSAKARIGRHHYGQCDARRLRKEGSQCGPPRRRGEARSSDARGCKGSAELGC